MIGPWASAYLLRAAGGFRDERNQPTHVESLGLRHRDTGHKKRGQAVHWVRRGFAHAIDLTVSKTPECGCILELIHFS